MYTITFLLWLLCTFNLYPQYLNYLKDFLSYPYPVLLYVCKFQWYLSFYDLIVSGYIASLLPIPINVLQNYAVNYVFIPFCQFLFFLKFYKIIFEHFL